MSKNDISIEPSDDGTYIIVTYRCPLTNKIAMDTNIKAHALGRELGIRKYLVDTTRGRNTETPVDHYDFAYNEMKGADSLDNGAVVAMVVDANDSSHDFIETVCNNAGFNVKIFRDDFESALIYLRSINVH